MDVFSSDLKEKLYCWFVDFKQRSLNDSSTIEEQVTLMNTVNPAIVLRNYLAQEAIDFATQGDYSRIYELLVLIKNPYTMENIPRHFIKKRPAWAMEKAGCSALSCSS